MLNGGPRQQPLASRNVDGIKPRKQENEHVYLDADIYQAAVLNVKLPPGFRLECEDIILRAMQKRMKQEKERK